MASLEYSFAKEWARLLNSEFIRAARLAKVGRIDDIDFIIDDDKKRMSALLKKQYRRTATIFGNKAFNIIASQKFITVPEIKTPKEDFWKEMNNWANVQAAQKVSKISKTSKNTIANIISKGQRDQLSTVDISKNIRKTGLITSRHRARTIALTETHTASVKSMDSAVKSTRIEMEREWVSARDTRTRRPGKANIWNHYNKFPIGADGERVKQDQDFIGTGQAMAYPGDPKGAAGNVIRCLTNYGTPIYTSSGWKQVRYIVPGDLVLTHKNRFKKVLRINRSPYDGEVVKVSVEGQGRYIVVTPEHPFLILDERLKTSEWREAKDIVEGDIIGFMVSHCNQVGVVVRSVSKRQLKETIRTYNFAVEDDESYIAKGFVNHNCRCVLIYHTVKKMEELKPYVPEPSATLDNISIGSPAKSAREISNHYKKSKGATFIEEKTDQGLKKDIQEKLGKQMFDIQDKDMDNLMRFMSERFSPTLALEDYEVAARNIIQQWAGTSGDTTPKSIMMQLAAKKEFGLEGTTIWWEKEALKEATELFEIHEKAMRRFLRTMYDNTQDHLAKQGLKTVRVARGHKGNIGINPSTIKNPVTEIDIELQPMSSFSSSFETAQEFATDIFQENNLFFAEIPANRVLSTPVTGFGCKAEQEFVILGSQKGKEKVLGSVLKKYDSSIADEVNLNWEKLFGATSTTLSEEEIGYLLTEKITDAIHRVTK